jgi:hypothetical protein
MPPKQDHSNNRASKHATNSKDLVGLLPRGAGQEKLASQLLKVAMRSEDRWIDKKKKMKRKKKQPQLKKKRATNLAFLDISDDDSEAGDIDDIAVMNDIAQQSRDRKKEALIAQITNAKRAQEIFDIERATAKAKQERQMEIAQLQRAKEEKYQAWVNRTHRQLYYLAGRGDVTKLNDMWETIDRRVLLRIIDKCIDEDNQDTILLWGKL